MIKLAQSAQNHTGVGGLLIKFFSPLCFLLFVGLLLNPTTLAEQPPTPPTQDADCESKYEGITYCQEDDGDVHVIVIDLQDPHIHFEMVMANDAPRTNTIIRQREKVDLMAHRYQDKNPVVAINGDYFGHVRGPEGLSVKNGVRIDRARLWDANPNAVWRSSLAISRFNEINIGRKTAKELSDSDVYHDRFYNVVGGAPLIIEHGVSIPNAIACFTEKIPPGSCRRTIQTVVGVSEDGEQMIISVGQGRDVEGMAELLLDYGAYTALKLDAGGSSQLWYDGEMRHDTSRPVANGLLVFYSPTTRHDAALASRPHYPVLTSGQSHQINIELENTGFMRWNSALDYRLRNVQGWSVVNSAIQPLGVSVEPNETAAIPLQIVAPTCPGVYDLTWRLLYRWVAFGPPIRFSIVVVPPSAQADQLQAQIESLIAVRWDSRHFENNWPQLKKEIEALIRTQIDQHLAEIFCSSDSRWQLTPTHTIWRDLLVRPVEC